MHHILKAVLKDPISVKLALHKYGTVCHNITTLLKHDAYQLYSHLTVNRTAPVVNEIYHTALFPCNRFDWLWPSVKTESSLCSCVDPWQKIIRELRPLYWSYWFCFLACLFLVLLKFHNHLILSIVYLWFGLLVCVKQRFSSTWKHKLLRLENNAV